MTNCLKSWNKDVCNVVCDVIMLCGLNIEQTLSRLSSFLKLFVIFFLSCTFLHGLFLSSLSLAWMRVIIRTQFRKVYIIRLGHLLSLYSYLIEQLFANCLFKKFMDYWIFKLANVNTCRLILKSLRSFEDFCENIR